MTRDDTRARRPSAWNIANALTVVRVLLVPLFGWLLLVDEGRSAGFRWAALACFVVAMVTDRIDGDLARSRGLVTDFGKVADPIADKALMSMALVGLSMIGEVWCWVTILILVREWGVTLVRIVVLRYGVMAAGRGGKLKTLLQTLAIGMLVLPRFAVPGTGLLDWVAHILLALALAVTVVTGVDYVLDAYKLRRDAKARAG